MWLAIGVHACLLIFQLCCATDEKSLGDRNWNHLNTYFLALEEKFDDAAGSNVTLPHPLVSACRNLKYSGLSRSLEFDPGWMSCVPDFTDSNWKPFPYGNISGQNGKLCYTLSGLNTAMGLCSDGRESLGNWPFVTNDCLSQLKNTNTWFNENATIGCFVADGETFCQKDKLKNHISDCFRTKRSRKMKLCLPKFINLGLHKTGTSTQHDFMRGQRGWITSVIKEPNFWKVSPPSRKLKRNKYISATRFPFLENYLKRTLKKNANSYFGDYSVALTHFITAPIYAKHTMPDAKFTVTLREPIDTLMSHFFFSSQNKSLDHLLQAVHDDATAMVHCQTHSDFLTNFPHKFWDPLCFFHTLRNNTLNLLHDTMVLDGLLPWFSYFPRESFHFMSTKRSTDPQSYRDMFDFLNIPQECLNTSNIEHKNKNTGNKQKFEFSEQSKSTDEYLNFIKFLDTFSRLQSKRLSKIIDIPRHRLFE